MVVELANYSAMFQSNWGLGCFVALVVIAIALSVIAVILTCFNWIVVYWILTEDNIYQGRKFLQDIYKHSGIVCIISFIGLLMLVLLGVIPIVLDESQLDIYYYAWVCKHLNEFKKRELFGSISLIVYTVLVATQSIGYRAVKTKPLTSTTISRPTISGQPKFT